MGSRCAVFGQAVGNGQFDAALGGLAERFEGIGTVLTQQIIGVGLLGEHQKAELQAGFKSQR